MSGYDSEDNTTTESGQTTDMFKAALAPVLSQLTNLNANVSSVPLDRHDEPNKVDETAAAGGPAKSADMDANLSIRAPAPAGKDKNNVAMPGDDLLKKLS